MIMIKLCHCVVTKSLLFWRIPPTIRCYAINKTWLGKIMKCVTDNISIQPYQYQQQTVENLIECWNYKTASPLVKQQRNGVFVITVEGDGSHISACCRLLPWRPDWKLESLTATTVWAAPLPCIVVLPRPRCTTSPLMARLSSTRKSCPLKHIAPFPATSQTHHARRAGS